MKIARNLVGRISLILFGLLLPFLALEIVVRLLNFAPPPIPNPTIWEEHADLGWWHIPNSGGTFYSSFTEYETEVYINSLGLREDRAIDSYDILGDKFRLLILADSYGEALEVPLEKTFFKQLQILLTQNGRPTQTINAGVGSWGTDQQATFYRIEGYKYKPDLTLLFFYIGNDVVNNYAPFEVARTGGAIQKDFYQLDQAGQLVTPDHFDRQAFKEHLPDVPKPTPRPAYLSDLADWLWLNSHLYRWGAPYLQEIPVVLRTLGPTGFLGGQAYISATYPGEPITFFVYQTPLTEAWQSAWQLTEALLVYIRDQIRADGGQFAVIIIPTREQVYPDSWERTINNTSALQAITWDLALPNQQLAAILTRNQIPYLDLLPSFETAVAQPDAPRFYLRRNGHWTEAGHKLAGTTIYEFLQQSDWLK